MGQDYPSSVLGAGLAPGRISLVFRLRASTLSLNYSLHRRSEQQAHLDTGSMSCREAPVPAFALCSSVWGLTQRFREWASWSRVTAEPHMLGPVPGTVAGSRGRERPRGWVSFHSSRSAPQMVSEAAWRRTCSPRDPTHQLVRSRVSEGQGDRCRLPWRRAPQGGRPLIVSGDGCMALSFRVRRRHCLAGRTAASEAGCAVGLMSCRSRRLLGRRNGPGKTLLSAQQPGRDQRETHTSGTRGRGV